MSDSLYAIFKPLVDEGHNGTVLIEHASGDQAAVWLEEGRIGGIRLGDLTGMLAGKELSMWLSFTVTCCEQPQPMADDVAGLDTQHYMTLLSKIDEQTAKMKSEVAIDCVILKVTSFEMPGTKEFKPEELRLLLAIDGQSTVKQLARRLRIPEFRALSFTYRFCRIGLVKKIDAYSPLDQKTTASFLSSLTAFLAEQVGPAAEIIVNKAFEYLESDPRLIFKSEFPDLIGAISNHLEDEDGMAFKKWALESWQNY
ncbi:MAG: hypothetical protein QNJ61_08195 [Desulfobacterales bacterium]|nr:hypothetical protein [Desulfobacterales bacterium]